MHYLEISERILNRIAKNLETDHLFEDVKVQKLSDGHCLFATTEVNGEYVRFSIHQNEVGYSDSTDPDVVIPEGYEDEN